MTDWFAAGDVAMAVTHSWTIAMNGRLERKVISDVVAFSSFSFFSFLYRI